MLLIRKASLPGKMRSQGREGAGSDCVYAIEAKTRCSIREAIDGKTTRIPLRESAGRTAGEFAYIYPPGIPLIAPGECITEQLLEVILDYIRKGFRYRAVGSDAGDNTCIRTGHLDRIFNRKNRKMGYIFYVMGKSAAGKDTIYKELVRRFLNTAQCVCTPPGHQGRGTGGCGVLFYRVKHV